MKREKTYSSRPVCLLAPAALIVALGLGTASHAFAAQEIDVQGNSTSIISGDIKPDVADDTDFGRVDLGTDEVKTYTILNTGDADLLLEGTAPNYVALVPVADGDTGCDVFTVTQPTSTTIAADANTTFTVTYNQAAPGSVDECKISIANNDTDENPYTFVIQGSTNPEMGVKGGADDNLIVDGAATTDADNGTLFAAGSTLEKTYTITNAGTDLDLGLTGDPIVALSGEGCAAFEVTTQPTTTSIAAGLDTTFAVTYTPPTPETGAPCTVSIANDIDAENPYDFVIQAELPEIDVQGNSVSIVDGDDTPSAADYTDFGGLPTGTDVGSKTYTIRNIGGKVLNLDGDPLVNKVPVATGDAGCEAFVVTQPTVTTLATGEETTFTVTYSQNDPNITDKCKISIANDDSDEDPYDFVIQASTGPEMDISGGPNGDDEPIADGDTTTSADNGTRFARTDIGSTLEKTYTITNNGGADLKLTGDPLVALIGESCAAFSVTQPDEAGLPIEPAKNATFKVTYAPTADTPLTAEPCTVSIDNDDSNENPYDFVIQAGLPEIDVQGKGVSIADGDDTPSATDDTDFGGAPVNTDVTREYTILNTGVEALTLSTVTKATTADCDTFAIGTLGATSVAPGDETTFKVTYKQADPGITNTCKISIANDDPDEAAYDFVIQASTGPEMDVKGNSKDIDDGAETASADNDTLFASDSAAEKTYTIENNGGAALNLTAEDPDPLVALSGEGCGGFEVTTQPAKIEIAAQDKTTFTVKYTPPTTKTGAPCIVSIANDDGNENPYDFVIQANLPEIDVQGNSVSIADGDTTPSAADDTSFGEVAVGESMVKTYTIKNIGGASLTLDNGTDPIVSLIGDGCDDGQFTFTQPEESTVPAGQSTTFEVTYTPTSTKRKKCTVNITNGDSNEDPYNFVIQGGKSESLLPALYPLLMNRQ